MFTRYDYSLKTKNADPRRAIETVLKGVLYLAGTVEIVYLADELTMIHLKQGQNLPQSISLNANHFKTS